jgi:transposase
MMGQADEQRRLFYGIQLEDLVPADHPLRRIRPLIDTERIRALCRPLYCPDNGRPSIPPEQLFLALLGGYLLGVRSDRKLILELQCNMAFRWFVGLDLDTPVWDPSTFSKNREGRFDESDVLAQLFDDTVRLAMQRGLVSLHWSVDGTLVRADASHKSFVPLEVYQRPADYRRTLTGAPPPASDDDPGNPTVNFRGQRRTNATHRSTTDPDARLARKAPGEAAQPSYTVNGIMENRHRLLLGIGVERFHGPTAERDGTLSLLRRIARRLKCRPRTLGGDKGYFEKIFLRTLFRRGIEPHIAPMSRGTDPVHTRVRQRQRGLGFRLSQLARKKIEELWGEAKEEHAFRRFTRRTLRNVRQEALLLGWLLNLKRLAALGVAPG